MSNRFSVVLVNNFPIAGTVCFTADHLAHAYTTATGTTDLVGDPVFDLAASTTPRYTPTGSQPVLFFELAPKQSVTVWMDVSLPFSNGEAWFAPFGTIGSAVATPEKKTTGRVDFGGDQMSSAFISAMEGVSAGVRLSGSSGSTSLFAMQCAPNSNPTLVYALQTDQTSGYSVVLSPKYTETVNTELAVCDKPPQGYSACIVHRCRVYYAQQAATGRSFLNWLKDTSSVAMGWKFDNWECADERCGYRDDGVGAPMQLTSDGLGNTPFASVVKGSDGCQIPNPVTITTSAGATTTAWDPFLYSCGFVTGLAKPWSDWLNAGYPTTVPPLAGPTTWWKPLTTKPTDAIGVQCSEKKIANQLLIQRAIIPSDAIVTIEFNNLEWLSSISNQTTVVPSSVDFTTFTNDAFLSADGRRTSATVLPPEPSRTHYYVALILLALFVCGGVIATLYFMRSSFDYISQIRAGHATGVSFSRAPLTSMLAR